MVSFSRFLVQYSRWALTVQVFNEFFSGFDNIGHNTILALIPLWIIPNGAWIVFPTFMMYDFGKEIVAALGVAESKRK